MERFAGLDYGDIDSIKWAPFFSPPIRLKRETEQGLEARVAQWRLAGGIGAEPVRFEVESEADFAKRMKEWKDAGEQGSAPARLEEESDEALKKREAVFEATQKHVGAYVRVVDATQFDAWALELRAITLAEEVRAGERGLPIVRKGRPVTPEGLLAFNAFYERALKHSEAPLSGPVLCSLQGLRARGVDLKEEKNVDVLVATLRRIGLLETAFYAMFAKQQLTPVQLLS